MTPYRRAGSGTSLAGRWRVPKLYGEDRWPQPLLLPLALKKPTQDGRRRLAVPFDLPELPGIVPYAVLFGLSEAEWAAVAATVLALFREEIRRRKEEFEKSVGQGGQPSPVPAPDFPQLRAPDAKVA